MKRIGLFATCLIDQFYPHVGFKVASTLERLGFEVVVPQNQTCCGQPAFNAGFWDEAKSVCNKFIKDFEGSDYIVAPSASCAGFVRNYYSTLFDNSSVHNEVKGLSKRVYEFSEFMVKVLQIFNVGAKLQAKATYHDSCAGLRECKIKQEPRKCRTRCWSPL